MKLRTPSARTGPTLTSDEAVAIARKELDRSNGVSLFPREDIEMNTQPVSRNMPERMDLPFVGIATFAGQPACTDWDKLDGADVAVLGIPIDTASRSPAPPRTGI